MKSTDNRVIVQIGLLHFYALIANNRLYLVNPVPAVPLEDADIQFFSNVLCTAHGYTCQIQFDARLFHVTLVAVIILRGPAFKPRHMERDVVNVVIRLRSY